VKALAEAHDDEPVLRNVRATAADYLDNRGAET
jgi:hypothetical protein